MARSPPQPPPSPSPPSTPPRVPGFIGNILGQIAGQLRGYVQDAGTSCSLPECGAVTLGVRCEVCLRRLCMGHTLFKVGPGGADGETMGLRPICIYCEIAANPTAFDEDDDDVGG